MAGGAAFVVLGGPRRIVRRVKRAVSGEPAPLPSSLPLKDVEKAIRSLGSDGEKVRGALERSFASYLAKNSKLRLDCGVCGATGGGQPATAIRVAGRGVGLQLVKRALAGETSGGGSAFDQMRRIIQRGTTGTAPGYDIEEDADPPGATGTSGSPAGTGVRRHQVLKGRGPSIRPPPALYPVSGRVAERQTRRL